MIPPFTRASSRLRVRPEGARSHQGTAQPNCPVRAYQGWYLLPGYSQRGCMLRRVAVEWVELDRVLRPGEPGQSAADVVAQGEPLRGSSERRC